MPYTARNVSFWSSLTKEKGQKVRKILPCLRKRHEHQKIKWRLLKERRYKWAVREMEMRFRYAKSKFDPVTPDRHFRRELWENWTGGTAV